MSVLMRAKQHIFGLNADLLALQNADAAEKLRAEAAELALQTAIADEETRALAAEALLQTAIDDEAIDRAAAIAQEVIDRDAAIEAAKLALGTNFTVGTIAGRDALTGLTVSDRVLVQDNGDGKWALYHTATVTDGAGSTSTFTLLADQDSLENSISATAIKAAYESNADTNAFTDAEQAKVGFVSVTAAIDLDKVIQSDELVVDGTLAAVTDVQIASALAVKTYVTEAVRVGGAVFKTESLVVAADKIVLTHAPKDGLVLNFATVRHIDANGVSFDIPVAADVADVSGKTFILAPDAAGQFDAKSVLVQYPYVPAA